MKEYDRIQKILDVQDDSVFLWGARQVGKSTLVKRLFPNAIVYDLLKSDEYYRPVFVMRYPKSQLTQFDTMLTSSVCSSSIRNITLDGFVCPCFV